MKKICIILNSKYIGKWWKVLFTRTNKPNWKIIQSYNLSNRLACANLYIFFILCVCDFFLPLCDYDQRGGKTRAQNKWKCWRVRFCTSHWVDFHISNQQNSINQYWFIKSGARQNEEKYTRPMVCANKSAHIFSITK